MRLKKTILNIAVSFLLEAVSILSGFVIPVLIIRKYGSDVNGLTQSITNFLGYVAVLQLGAGSVIKAILYKPLAKKDIREISVIVKTSNAFFRKIGIAGLVYMAVMSIVFPLFITPQYSFIYTFSLVIIIGFGVLGQYFFGITYQMILEADQKSYVYSFVQIVSILLNTLFAYLVISLDLSIQVYKIITTLLFLARPLILRIYVNKKYHIDKKVRQDYSLMNQRWDGFAHGLAYYIHSKADIFVLTICSTLSLVSVYSVYAIITTGLNSVITRIDSAVRPVFGNIIANSEENNLQKSFNAYNTVIHVFCSIAFSTAVVTAQKFVVVYSHGITDAEYIQPVFSFLILTAEFLYCIRSPYNSIIFTANKFKETKSSAFIEAGLNIIISIILVPFWGLVGVAIGTLIAMAYRTIYFIVFLKKQIICYSYISQIKRYSVTLISYLITIMISSRISYEVTGYLSWVAYAAIICCISICVNGLINIAFEWNDIKLVLKRVRIIK